MLIARPSYRGAYRSGSSGESRHPRAARNSFAFVIPPVRQPRTRPGRSCSGHFRHRRGVDRSLRHRLGPSETYVLRHVKRSDAIHGQFRHCVSLCFKIFLHPLVKHSITEHLQSRAKLTSFIVASNASRPDRRPDSATATALAPRSARCRPRGGRRGAGRWWSTGAVAARAPSRTPAPAGQRHSRSGAVISWGRKIEDGIDHFPHVQARSHISGLRLAAAMPSGCSFARRAIREA